MFKRFAEFVEFAFNLSKRSENHDRRLTAAEERINQLTRTVDLLLVERQHSREHEQSEREKQDLRLQLALERLERRLALPPANEGRP